MEVLLDADVRNVILERRVLRRLRLSVAEDDFLDARQ